ncbi:MAG: hypothetical protein PHU98_06185 [Mariniphaga sp.]|nr:hypothetical protein [Paludibacter sp.]MDD4225959.1 hypothetical protein [Mariniphaga sp.]
MKRLIISLLLIFTSIISFAQNYEIGGTKYYVSYCNSCTGASGWYMHNDTIFISTTALSLQGWDTTDILQHTDTSVFSFNSTQADTSVFSFNSTQADTSVFSWSSENLQGHDTNWVINMKQDSVWDLITATNADIDTLTNSNVIAIGNITADTLKGYTAEQLHFATIYDTTIQTFASTTKAYPLTFNCNGAIYGITHTAGDSVITVANSATYKFLVSSIADMTVGTNGKLEIWFRLNDIDVPYSNTIVNIPSSVETTLVVEMILVLHAGDKVKLMRRASDTNVRILFTTKGTSPVRPATPSSILTVLKVSKYH